MKKILSKSCIQIFNCSITRKIVISYGDSFLTKTAKGIGYTVLGAAGAAGVGGVVVLGSVFGTAVGAGMGEIIDHVPYFNHAIPDGIRFVAGYFNPEAAQGERELAMGNVDKLGAVCGFVGGFYRSSLSVRRDRDD